MVTLVPTVVLLLLLFSIIPAHSAVFNIPSGNVPALIAAINAANANGEENTIILAPGIYTVIAPLPSITSTQRIQGAGAPTTIIETDPSTISSCVLRDCRSIFQVAFVGTLILDRLTVRGGERGIFNSGELTVTKSIISDNKGGFGGGIFNDPTGTVVIINSTVTRNSAGGLSAGGMYNAGGIVTIDSSAFTNNTAPGAGGLLNAGGRITIDNSTFARNASLTAGAIANVLRGQGTITNSTISDNTAVGGGGIINAMDSILALQNTILARNGGDCFDLITSLGNNLIGVPSGCTNTLQPTDLTGDPGLAAFIDDGTPGNGHFPLLEASPAIDAGDNDACPATDQIGEPRVGTCDIGAIEFQPMPVLTVAVDIRPGGPNNNINPNSNAIIPVEF